MKHWEQFEKRLSIIYQITGYENGVPPYEGSTLLFRGHADSGWALTSTLDRSLKRKYDLVSEYFRFTAARVQKKTENLTGLRWDGLPTLLEVENWLSNPPDWDLYFPDEKTYEFMIYLRHHSFPSPLLDWTRSPYIAAFFAFQHPMKVKCRAIWVYSDRPKGSKIHSSAEANIRRLGPFTRAHRRHELQQADYTVCTQIGNYGLTYVSHEEAFKLRRPHQDLLFKLTIPNTERDKILRQLVQHNINAFALYDTQDTLMETVSWREGLRP